MELYGSSGAGSSNSYALRRKRKGKKGKDDGGERNNER
jgi:hypothetical protein